MNLVTGMELTLH